MSPTPRGGAAAADPGTELMSPAETSALAQVKALVETREADLLAVLPAHVSRERLLGVYLHALERNPTLLTCSPASLVRALMHAAETGLEPTGVLGLAYLVPRWNSKTRRMEAHFEIGYRGMLDLARASKEVAVVDAHNVFYGDTYRVTHGTTPAIVHRPTSKERTWDNLRGAYAFAKLTSGELLVEEMSKEELEVHRDRYAPRNKDGELTGPWTTDPDRLEMGRKTPIRRLAKRLPLNRRAERALQLADESYEDTGGLEPPARQVAASGSKRDRILEHVSGKAEPVNVTPQPEPIQAEATVTPGGQEVSADGEVVNPGTPDEVIGEPEPTPIEAPPPVAKGTSYSGQVEFSDRAATNGTLRKVRGTSTLGFRLVKDRRGVNVETTGVLAESLDKVFESNRLGGGSPVTVIGSKEQRSFEKEGEGTIRYDVIVAEMVTDGAGSWAS